MGLLGRKNDDFELLDLTLLRKKGILKIPEEKDVVDFSQIPASQDVSMPNMPSLDPAIESNPFGFLDSVAQASSSASTGIPNSSDANAMKIKLDDFEYKLERLSERLERIESKLGSS